MYSGGGTPLLRGFNLAGKSLEEVKFSGIPGTILALC